MDTLLALVLVAQTAPLPQELTDESFEKVRGFIVPDDKELAWRKVGWRATFLDGVVEAQKADKPVLLWTMNGHPLGHC
jgi:hypothetical protein